MLPAPMTQKRITRAPGGAEPVDQSRDTARSLLGWPTIVCDFSARQGVPCLTADARDLDERRAVPYLRWMDFRLSPEQEEFRRAVVRFVDAEIAPVAHAIDEAGEFPRA